jgi:hypothetical protein
MQPNKAPTIVKATTTSHAIDPELLGALPRPYGAGGGAAAGTQGLIFSQRSIYRGMSSGIYFLKTSATTLT